MRALPLLVPAAGALGLLLLAEVRGGQTRPGAAVLFVSMPAGAVPPAPGRLPPGSRIEAVPLEGGAAPRVLTGGFAAAGAPSPSFDGTTVLFSGRAREGDRDSIFSMAPDGTGARPVASSPDGDCATPALLPEGVVFSAPAAGAPGTRALFVASPDGGAPRRITFHASGEDGDPFVLGDGRILFRHREGGRSDLLAVHVDGTGVHPFHGRDLPAAACGRPREGADRGLLLVEGGRAVRIDPRRPGRAGTDASPGLDGTVAAVEFLPGGGLLVAHRPAAGRPTLGLRVLLPGGPPAGTVLADDPDRDETDPVVAAPRRRPKGHLSTVDPSGERGSVFCVDARRLPRRLPGAPAATVRLSDPDRVLGEVPLAPDGSFWADLPPDRPIRIEALRADGSAVAGSGFSFWVRPGENRGCVGCHEDPAAAPPNVFPAAIRGTPADLARPAPRRSAR